MGTSTTIEENILTKLKTQIKFDPIMDIFTSDTYSSTIGDIAFVEFEKEIAEAASIKKDHEYKMIMPQKTNDYNDIEQIEELEELDDEPETFEDLNLDILETIEIKVLNIIRNVNISLFQKNKDGLKNAIINDMIQSLFHDKISENMRNKISDIVSGIVDHEFKEYGRKIRQRKKELFEGLRDKIHPFLYNTLFEYKKHRLTKVTTRQLENYYKYLFEIIESEYIQPERKEKKINAEEYEFICDLIKKYIENMMENI